MLSRLFLFTLIKFYVILCVLYRGLQELRATEETADPKVDL